MTSILVLDDRAENHRQLMTAVLGSRYTVIEAETGHGARLVLADPPDLVIADVLMPEMDGYEFVRELRRQPSNEHTRVMFCTATYGEDEIRALATALRRLADPVQAVRAGRHLRGGGQGVSPTAGRLTRRWPLPTSTSICASSTAS